MAVYEITGALALAKEGEPDGRLEERRELILVIHRVSWSGTSVLDQGEIRTT